MRKTRTGHTEKEGASPSARVRRETDTRPLGVPAAVSGPELIAPYRRMAMHVIARAFRDLASPVDSPTAREFLDDSPMLRHWSAVAALNPASIVASAELLIATLGEAGNGSDRPVDVEQAALKRRPARPAAGRAGV
jgi:hypothetical protein